MRWEIPGVYTERFDRIASFNPDIVNPVLAGQLNPVTGQPYMGAYVLVNSPAAAGAWLAAGEVSSVRSPRGPCLSLDR